MSKEIEIEFKSMLTPDEYIELLRYYNVTDEQFVMQTNLYFDTADFQLKHLGMGLRIRRFTSKAEATLKIPQEVGLLEVTDSSQWMPQHRQSKIGPSLQKRKKF